MRGARAAGRVMANRLVAALTVPAALFHIAVSARIRPGSPGMVAARWIRFVGALTGVKFRSEGRIEPPSGTMRVIVANHSSPLDIAALLAGEPNMTFVAAAELFRVPLLAAAMRALGTVAVDRRSGTGVHLELPAALDSPDLLLAVFPEGGIAPAGGRMPFRRSPFALAITHGATIIPVAIHRSAQALAPRSGLALRPATVTVEFLDPIATTGRTLADRYRLCELAERRIGEALRRNPGPTQGAAPGPVRRAA